MCWLTFKMTNESSNFCPFDDLKFIQFGFKDTGIQLFCSSTKPYLYHTFHSVTEYFSELKQKQLKSHT